MVRMPYSIYQLRDDADKRLLFSSSEEAEKYGGIRKENYECVYAVYLVGEDAEEICEELYRIFNTAIPADFRGHSLSVSDVIVLGVKDAYEAWYCENVGFKKIEDWGR